MSQSYPQRQALAKAAAIHCARFGRPTVLTIMILVHTGHALATEQPSTAITPVTAEPNDRPAAARAALPLTGSMFDLPKTYQPIELPADLHAPGNFRPRGRSLRESEPTLGAPEDLPMLRTTMWDRLADYRSHGRVRLLTLWEAGDNSFSLQAGKKGEPSLQWTSRSMNRGGATRGLFDRLVSDSVSGASRGLHPTPHSTAVEGSARAAKVLEAGLNGPNK